MWATLEATRDLGRVREIAGVFAKHGLGHVLQRLGLAKPLRRAGILLRVARPLEHEPSAPARLRTAFEELGPTFVKLGQLLAGRTDLLDEEWTNEFARLREHARPVEWNRIRAQLEEDLGADPDSVFLDLERAPLAAASIAQVHGARLPDGRPVVLKVRRPGIVERVEEDLRLLARLADLAEREVPELRRWRLRAIARQFSHSLRNELDLTFEARMSERIANDIAAQREVFVPRVHARFSTPRLCVQDRVDGASLDAWIAAGRPGDFDSSRIASIGARVVLEMVFVHGVYHADPHGGNVLLTPDGRLALLDFGMVGRLSPARRAEFLELLSAAVSRRDERVVEVLTDWAAHQRFDEAQLVSDVSAFLDRYHGCSLQEIDLTKLLRDLAAVLRDNDLALPVDVAALLKVFVTLQDLGRSLDPGFHMSLEAEEFTQRQMARESSPLSLLRRGIQGLQQVASTLPHDLHPLLARLRRGGLRVEIDLPHSERLVRELERSVNRLTIGLVTAALIVGTSVALTVPGGPRLYGFPAFALLGFASSLVLGAGLLVAIARSGRP